MPEPGQKMYMAFNGELRVVRFVREETASERTEPGYVIKRGNEQTRCPKDMYVETEREAWEKDLKIFQDTLPGVIKHAEEAQQAVVHCKSEIERITQRIAELS